MVMIAMAQDLVGVREQTVEVTEAAREQIKRVLDEKGKEGSGIRLYVSGGGCSGLQYGMALDDAPRDDDHVISKDGVRVFVDSLSAGYLIGSTVDYVESIQASGFKIDNPNAVQSCGCGHSFRTEEKSDMRKVQRC
jgi:iron-sulfur cluster assembly protein